MSATGISLPHLVRPPAPGANAPGVKPPLLILLHGVRSNEQSIGSLATSLDPRFVIVSLRSPLTLGPGQYAWFTVQFTMDGPVIDARQAQAAWTRVPELIDEAVTEHGADPARVYVGGFSQGGIVALATLLTAPEKVAGAVVMSGRLLPEVLPFVVSPQRLAAKPLLWVHGTADEVLGIDYLRSAVPTLMALRLALTTREFAMGHSVTAESLGAVHAWLGTQLDARDR